jgi:hypothetical protein
MPQKHPAHVQTCLQRLATASCRSTGIEHAGVAISSHYGFLV